MRNARAWSFKIFRFSLANSRMNWTTMVTSTSRPVRKRKPSLREQKGLWKKMFKKASSGLIVWIASTGLILCNRFSLDCSCLVGWTKSESPLRGRTTSAFERLHYNLEEIFRAQWTANANAMSVFYSGTPAQKTDFTATGRRTYRGALNDGHASIKRWLLGNFYDSREQDMIDFHLCRLKPMKNIAERFNHSPVNAVWVLLFVVNISLFR